ncbi:MAG TPA: hypothetical protein VKS78_19765 [Roseiarcus sp.]|nr:hypothetical protein [Roseiarcus sp.]
MSSVDHSSAPTSASESPQTPHPAAAIEKPAGTSRLLRRLYHDVGLAAVAAELQVNVRATTPDLAAAIDRGAPLLKAGNSERAA